MYTNTACQSILKASNARSLYFILSVVTLGMSSAHAGTEVTNFHISGLLGESRSPFELRIACTPGPAPHVANAHGRRASGDSCWLSTLELVVSGKAYEFPPASFTDLANPQLLGRVLVSSEGSETSVGFSGGDGESAFEVTFVFAGSSPLIREISEFNTDGEWVKVSQSFW
jgi:hypothetical protein